MHPLVGALGLGKRTWCWVVRYAFVRGLLADAALGDVLCDMHVHARPPVDGLDALRRLEEAAVAPDHGVVGLLQKFGLEPTRRHHAEEGLGDDSLAWAHGEPQHFVVEYHVGHILGVGTHDLSIGGQALAGLDALPDGRVVVLQVGHGLTCLADWCTTQPRVAGQEVGSHVARCFDISDVEVVVLKELLQAAERLLMGGIESFERLVVTV